MWITYKDLDDSIEIYIDDDVKELKLSHQYIIHKICQYYIKEYIGEMDIKKINYKENDEIWKKIYAKIKNL